MVKKRPAAAVYVQPYKHPSPNVPMSAIRRFARRIAERFHPRRIILFSSYAYGKPHAESDVDLLVVMPARNTIDQAIRSAFPRIFSLDLIVRTPWQLDAGSRRTIGSCVRSWRKGRSSMKRTTASWVRKAEEDIGGARDLAARKPPGRNLVCFHCQQAAEKYLPPRGQTP